MKKTSNIKNKVNNLKGKIENKLPKKKKEGENTKPKSKKVVWKTVLNVLLIIAIGIISIGLAFALYIIISSPDFEKEKLYQIEPTILYDVNGDELARVGEANATVVTYDEIPDVLIDALVATEDSRFFQHNGIDLFRFLKASVLQLLGKDDAGGASTLDMQVIKNRYTQTDTNTGVNANPVEEIVRKFQDVYMSVFKLEAKYTKEEIIEFYLNTFQFGGGNINYGGTFGIEQACQYFFGKSSKDINLAEATIIAGMFQAPSRYNPINNPEGCKNRQKTVLKLMVRHGYITEEQMNDVLAIPIESLIINHDTKNNMEVESNQAFIDYVLDEVSEDLGIDARKSSLLIYTTFDPKIQAVLEKVEDGKVYEFRNEKEDEGIAVTSTKDGSVVALSGGKNYQAQTYNWATDVNKQPGSTSKPLVEYAMYIENISKSTYAMFLDEPTNYTGGGSFSNYDGGYDGLIPMRWAVKDSRNIPAVLAFRELYNLDKNIILNFLDSVNIHPQSNGEIYESNAIGGWENGTSPLDLAAAYGAFARGGYYIEPYGYTKVIETRNNNNEILNTYEKKKVMEESTAYLMTNLLISAYDSYQGPANTDVAGKTGTTNISDADIERYHLKPGRVMDIWMITYSPSYTIGLWVGYDHIYENAEENGWYLTSSLGSKPRRSIMNYLSKNIHKKNEHFTVPKNVVKVQIEAETFPPQLCSKYTPTTDKTYSPSIKNEKMCLDEWFVKGTEPTDVSNRYDTLEDPTNGTYTYANNTITLKWNEIATPDAIDLNKLDAYFKKYYDSKYVEKYYNARLSYNNSKIGTLGYRIYLVNSDGTETEIGYTNSNTFSYNVTVGGEYTFKIKSSYSIFKDNISNGLVINAKTIDGNVSDWVEGGNGNIEGENSNPDTGLN